MNKYRNTLQDIKETSELMSFLTNMLESEITGPEYSLIARELNQLRENLKQLNNELGLE
jgi:hypothetical protein